jgi:hypothetical protein
MLRYLAVLAIAATVSLGMVSEAPAGACPGFGANCGCGAVIEVAEPCRPVVESYLVNQGPVLSGPGHYLGQLEDPRPQPCCYPYVGFVYSGYPYGAYGPGGYPRGFYSPYTGYPYAEPYPYFGRRAHRHVRHHVTRSVPAYYRSRHVPVAR